MKRCTKTMSGKHKFIDTSYYVMFELMYGEPMMIYGPIKCEYCGIINDLPKRKKI